MEFLTLAGVKLCGNRVLPFYQAIRLRLTRKIEGTLDLGLTAIAKRQNARLSA
jgi:hypothetical protein